MICASCYYSSRWGDHLSTWRELRFRLLPLTFLLSLDFLFFWERYQICCSVHCGLFSNAQSNVSQCTKAKPFRGLTLGTRGSLQFISWYIFLSISTNLSHGHFELSIDIKPSDDDLCSRITGLLLHLLLFFSKSKLLNTLFVRKNHPWLKNQTWAGKVKLKMIFLWLIFLIQPEFSIYR